MKQAKFILPVVLALMFAACEKPVAPIDNNGNEDVTYAIKMSDDGNGTATAAIEGEQTTEAEEGVTVTITATPGTDYSFAGWTTESAGVAFADATASTTTFTMPAGDVEIKAGFSLTTKYAITFTTGTNGTAIAKVGGTTVTEAVEGATVTITAAPEDSYLFEKWTTESAGVAFAGATASTTTFSMPANDVTIGAQFTEDPTFVDNILPEITDPAFKAFCEDAMANGYQYLDPLSGKLATHPAWDINSNGLLSSTEAGKVTALDFAQNTGIASFAGLEYFRGLNFLGCKNQNITSLDLSDKSSLVVAWINYNSSLTSLDVSGCPALEYLDCSINRITSLDLTGCPALGFLYCQNNQLPSIDVSGCLRLSSLECLNNQFTSLDVSNNTALQFLNCDNNGLTTLDVSNNTALVKLGCSANQLTTLDVSRCMGMGELTCFNNQLTTLTMPNGSEMLSLVKCGQNLLSTLDVSDCQYLGYLDCKANKLTSVDVSNCEGLSEFYCQDNQLASLDVSDCPRLFKIHCYDNRMATLDLSVMAVEYEGQIWHAYAGKQTSDGTTAQTLALTIREYQKPYWDYKLSKDAQNGDINLTVRPD